MVKIDNFSNFSFFYDLIELVENFLLKTWLKEVSFPRRLIEYKRFFDAYYFLN